ncbi:MAG: enoyl-CoA hydratase/isomerase family protein [Deltaproteobacteria bacterium]|nr:enoyl-CoA hydratase/isomerase family protein [Deltaproteobacteria bacterium]
MSEQIDTGTEQLLGRVEDGVAVLTINRPEARNAMTGEWMGALRRLVPALGIDPQVGCVVLTGAGRAFCAGGDVKGMAGRGGGDRSGPVLGLEERIRALRADQAAVTGAIYELGKPVIAAIPGPAAGAGLSLALSCDMRFMAESAFITTAFRNVGFSGDYGGSWFLTKLVGTAKARYLSDRVEAKECERLGIANRVVPDAALEAETLKVAKHIAAGPTIAQGFMKENLNRAVEHGLRVCLDMEADRMLRTGLTEDHREAVKAFVEKRTPTFKGR